MDPSELLDRLRSENAALRARLSVSTPTSSALRDSVRDTVTRVRNCLAARDVRGALAILNTTTPHRFTAIYRFDGETLVNLNVFDRLDPEASLFPSIPVSASYCMYVRDPLHFFALEDSLTDARRRRTPSAITSGRTAALHSSTKTDRSSARSATSTSRRCP
jgi:hypothetical protein